ncbi:hypothetical protein KY308_03060 [Candidatus Woesearchaeota archaeon]|nr:hypothetical protein [Candidatus Woesearchaeota archaeon]
MKHRFLVLALLTLIGGCSSWPITSHTAYSPQTEQLSIQAYFCPEDNCHGIMADEISKAEKSAHCAFYELTIDDVTNALIQKSANAEVLLVTDNDNPTNLPFAITDNRTGLMHNKFCVIDKKTVITGSYNPTVSGLQNNNNLLIINSEAVSQNYESEFSEFEAGVFGKGNIVKNPVITYANGTKSIETYFCPEDWCSDKVLKTLAKAESSINFMIFSFTDDSIGDLLVKKHNEGVKVAGILEKSQNTNQYSEYKKLLNAGINVTYDTNPKFLHHKVFIIDNKIVITGSYNPTNNGDRVNDENLVIIHDEDIAKMFIEEFKRIY